MRYPLFLSDFDGTLVRADGTISQRNIEAIKEYRVAGGVFAVVTGRMLCSIRPRLKELGLEEGIVVAYQGGMIADVATGEILENDGFTPEEAIRAVTFLEREDLHIHVYIDDKLYCNRDDDALKSYEDICGVKGIVCNEPLSRFVKRKKKTVNKVLAILPSEEKAALIKRLQKGLGEGYFITASNDFLVEALPARVNKAHAVNFLAERFGIPREQVAAIGDQLNDLPLLCAAGGKFAVSNAQEDLKKIATVVSSCEEDGVAEALEIAMGGTR